MTYSTVFQQAQTQTPTATCAVCPFFKDYEEPRGRGWCNVFDHHVFRHHPCTNTCRSAIQSLLDLEPVTVRVELASKELDPDEDTPVHLHSFVTKVTVSKPTKQDVENAIALLGHSSEYDIAYYWIPQEFQESDAI
ncbi:hypothetical protein C7H19_18170 [Aphanothece hegewaldii CCALA 016]|uniref:Uncharacterized protein n=1 Tax=Aphanothece hegewaldii CCALA 016 TaxID=2107694 RepID=A0A2T1LU28_9CHRO|nr:hypothetical protein [Aphanothece hegewaldii]PSF34933.1 hypothetical protein C7H19_18170 [Aphanothece hegewaldii CCALA 016]